MSEENARQFIQEMQAMEAYFNNLAQRENALISVLREATAAIDSINALKEKPDSETLVPVGLGSYVQSKISSKDTVFLSIGAGIALEKDSDSAVNYLEARIKEIQVAVQDTSAKKQEIAARLEQGKAQLNQLMQAGAPRPGPGNV
ncbi:MAG: prefoldin subunit alpha [Thaumarchaeota archaeon]|nr:prefoldin subunit alpha [Nitrososphaerota archaeon]